MNFSPADYRELAAAVEAMEARRRALPAGARQAAEAMDAAIEASRQLLNMKDTANGF